MRILYGYYGERNAGDDAFTVICARMLQTVGFRRIGVLAKRLPAARLPGVSPLYTAREWKGMGARLERWRIARWMRGGAAMVVGGGSVLQSPGALRDLEELLQRWPDRPHVALGVSIGPFASLSDEREIMSILPQFAFVGVRDRRSAHRAAAAGGQARVELTFDLAPLLTVACPEIVLPRPASRGGLGVALCGPATTSAQLQSLAHAINEWSGGRRERLVLISLNGDARKGDARAHQELAGLLDPAVEVEHHPYSGDPRRTFITIAGLRGIVAGRLHAAVFGYCAGIPVLVAPYTEKSVAWAEMIGHPADFCLGLEGITPRHLRDLMTDPSVTRPALPVDEAVASACRNFDRRVLIGE